MDTLHKEDDDDDDDDDDNNNNNKLQLCKQIKLCPLVLKKRKDILKCKIDYRCVTSVFNIVYL